MTDHNIESAAGLEALFQEFKTARRVFEPNWMLNRAFFAGEQWVAFQAGRVGRPAGLDPNRQYVTDNRMKGLIVSRTARKSRNRPMFAATPQGGDEQAISNARMGERILENDWTGLKLQPKLYTALLWADICANGFIKVFWDSLEGEKVEALVDPNGNPLMGPSGGLIRPGSEDLAMLVQANPELIAEARPMQVGQGDVRNEVKSPFEIYPHPLATSMDDCEGLFDETVRSKEYVDEHYPENLNGQAFEATYDADIPTGITEGFAPGLGGIVQSGSGSGRGIRVREYHCRPNRRYTNGCRVTWINQTIVRMDDAPDDPMPFVKFDSVEVPGRFWSDPIASDLRPRQVDLNSLATQIKENARLVGNPSLMSSRQAKIEYHGVPGEHVKYDSTVMDPKPEYLVPPPLQQYMENEVTRILQSMEEIAGIHEVSRAQVPNGITAASAINLLQESDETRLGPEIQQMEYSLGQWGTKILKLRARYNTDERLRMIAGDDSYWEPVKFRGEMLGPDPHVEVQPGSQIPRSKAAMQATMTEILTMLVQNGHVPDERNFRKFLKSYEIGGLDSLFEGVSQDARQVGREIRQMMAGIPVPINSFDNHPFHIDEITDFMKTDAYAEASEQAKACFTQHVAEHRQWMVDVANMQAQAQAEAQAAQQAQVTADAQETEIIKNVTSPQVIAPPQETQNGKPT